MSEAFRSCGDEVLARLRQAAADILRSIFCVPGSLGKAAETVSYVGTPQPFRRKLTRPLVRLS
jgi:hypothetical protein